MIADKSVLAIIPARGGSKGLPGKNLRLLHGKPLVSWTIEAAKAARHVDRVILSSDDEGIMDTARALGCEVPFRRPAGLARDDTTALEVVHHALAALNEHYQYVAWLQPTSPLRRAEDIDAAIALCETCGAPSCVSLCEAPKSPHWMFRVDDEHRLAPILDGPGGARRRQELPTAYVLNGAVYVADCAWIDGRESFLSPETVAHVMPAERSIDIDTEFDLLAADLYLSKGRCS